MTRRRAKQVADGVLSSRGAQRAAYGPAQRRLSALRGVARLYVAPIRALANNREGRLSTLTGLIVTRAGKRHGDGEAQARLLVIDEPPDVLAIRTESLEAMQFSTRTPTRRFLAPVRARWVDSRWQ